MSSCAGQFEARIDQISAVISESANLLVFLISSGFTFDVSTAVSNAIEEVAIFTVLVGILCGSILSAIRTLIIVGLLVQSFNTRIKAIKHLHKPFSIPSK